MHVDTDLLIIGGGSAGCLAAIAAHEQSPGVAVTILEKGGASPTRLSCHPGIDQHSFTDGQGVTIERV